MAGIAVLGTLALLAAVPQAAAQTGVDRPVPDAGRVLEQIQPERRLPEKPSVDLDVERRPAMRRPAGETLRVERLRITGATVFPTETLHALVADAEGRRLSLARLAALAQRITDYYRNHGYLISRAYLPAQTITGGVVEIAVLEGELGAVRIDDEAGLHGAALAPLEAIPTDAPLTANALERSLLLTSDVPGVNVTAILAPGATVGTADLRVGVTPAQRVTGFVSLDSYGNDYTGEARATGHVNFNNPLQLGDQLSLTGLISEDNLYYGRVAYQLPVNRWGTRAGAVYTYLDYRLGGDFEALDAEGNAGIASVNVRHPFVRSRAFNLYASLRYAHKLLEERIGAFDTETHAQLDNVTAGLSGDFNDSFGRGAVNAFDLRYTAGDLELDPASRAIDAATAETAGGFDKFNLGFQRLQRLSDAASLYLFYRGQYTDDNLDSAEQMSLGGAYGVRAYPQGEVSADEAHLLTVEGRLDLDLPWPGRWQAIAFIDHGYARLSAQPYTDEDNYRDLTGAGVGLNVYLPRGWRLRGHVAWRVGDDEPRAGDDDSPRAWLYVAKYF